jgi:hypothetical protein
MIRKVVFAIVAVLLSVAGMVVCADDNFVEDVYFWAGEPVKDADGKIIPNFNPKAKEIVFVQTVQVPDTVKAVDTMTQPQELREQRDLEEQPAQ